MPGIRDCSVRTCDGLAWLIPGMTGMITRLMLRPIWVVVWSTRDDNPRVTSHCTNFSGGIVLRSHRHKRKKRRDKQPFSGYACEPVSNRNSQPNLASGPHPVNPLCSSCRIRPGTKLVKTGRSGRFASWRCAVCLDRRSGSWVTGFRPQSEAAAKNRPK